MAFSNPVVGGSNGELIRAAIQSPDYVEGVSGWTINRDGTAEFNNVSIRIGADIGESIIVGPDNLPQVKIEATAQGGAVSFPSNTSGETTPAFISSSPDRRIGISSGATGDKPTSFISMGGETDDVGSTAQIILGILDESNPLTNFIRITSESVIFNTAPISMQNELRIAPTGTISGNYPTRVAFGSVSDTSANTTLSKTANTAVSNASTQVELTSGMAYEVTVQIQTKSSSGSSATGTQGVIWRLWEGEVGSGTVLGSPIELYTGSVGNAPSAQQICFLFKYDGSGDITTLNLSGLHFSGTDTVQAIVNSRYFMTVKQIGDPENINNM